MNKSELVDKIAQELNFSVRDVSSIIETILGAITETLVREENVEI